MSKKEKASPLHIKRTTGDWIFDIAVIIFFCLFTFICIFFKGIYAGCAQILYRQSCLSQGFKK